jgi:acetylornithine deacetylase/succinyl-diaminopimelate desuccinylase-like protein
MSGSSHSNSTIWERPWELLQNLIRFDTTNPPGNEAGCIAYIEGLLTEAGFDTHLLAKEPTRPNVVARLKGNGDAPPLLLYGHVDVVTTANQSWIHPPFGGEIEDGYVWGRGALDMKGGITMMLAALLRAKAKRQTLAGDVVLAIVCDEEAGGDFGVKYLVENHPEQFKGIRYALGEFGAFSIYIGGRVFYPIQISEKQVCWLKATVRGPSGHGAWPIRGSAITKLADTIRRLDQRRLPVHITPTARQMIETMAQALPFPKGLMLRLLLQPQQTGAVLKLMGEIGHLLEPMLYNTVNVTMIRGGEQFNVIPSRIDLALDGRLLPGYSPDDLIAELRRVIGDEVDLEVVRYDPNPSEPHMGLFDTLADVLREVDPGCVPLPLLLPATTDGRHLSRLGIQTYGFTPMKLPKEFNFSATVHAGDERIPVEALEFGANAIYKVLQCYGK